MALRPGKGALSVAQGGEFRVTVKLTGALWRFLLEVTELAREAPTMTGYEVQSALFRSLETATEAMTEEAFHVAPPGPRPQNSPVDEYLGLTGHGPEPFIAPGSSIGISPMEGASDGGREEGEAPLPAAHLGDAEGDGPGLDGRTGPGGPEGLGDVPAGAVPGPPFGSAYGGPEDRALELDFSEFHPLDHSVLSSECSEYPGGRMRHASLYYQYPLTGWFLREVWARVACPFGFHRFTQETWTRSSAEDAWRTFTACAACGEHEPEG